MLAPTASAQLRVTPCGPYLLGARVGTGGMAAVFAARQEGPGGVGRLVAVKVMRAALSDDERLKKLFLREATITTRLEHPNIVRVYDVGEAGGDIYLAMEFVHGVTLSALRAAVPGPLPLGIALRIVADVARALHAAHELCDVHGAPLQLVHQDVSPQNVMIGYDGVTKLLDFGVARIGALDTSRTESIPGKPSYLAPEQLDGGRIDQRADVFALGVVLHEAVTGVRLFARDTVAASYAAVLHDPIRDVRELRPEIPAEVAAVVARALHRSPAERFPDAGEARRALLAAATAAKVELSDEASLGDWLLQLLPPAASPADLERQIVQNALIGDEGGLDVSELETRPPDPAPGSPRSRSAAAPPAPRPGAGRERPEAAAPDDAGREKDEALALEGAARPAARQATAWGWVAGTTAILAGTAFLWSQQAGPARGAEPVAAVVREAPVVAGPLPAPSSLGATASAASVPTADPRSSPGPSPTVLAAASATGTVAARAPASTRQGAGPPGGGATTSPTPPAAPLPSPSTGPSSPGSAAASEPAASQGQSVIWVRSTPWGHVRVDGTSVGDSPVNAAVSSGTHTVTVTTGSGDEQRKTVTVQPGEQAKVKFVF